MSNDARIMLKATLTALKNQKKHVAGHYDLRNAYKTGWWHLKISYGEPLIVRTYENLTEGRFLEAARNGYTLMRFAPERFLLFAERRGSGRNLCEGVKSAIATKGQTTKGWLSTERLCVYDNSHVHVYGRWGIGS